MQPLQYIKLGLMTIGMTLDRAIMTRDRDNYKYQKRDERGRFAKENKPKKDNPKKKKHEHGMSSKEWAGLMHAVMTDMTREQREEDCVVKYYGDACYFLEKSSDGIYNVKYKIALIGADNDEKYQQRIKKET